MASAISGDMRILSFPILLMIISWIREFSRSLVEPPSTTRMVMGILSSLKMPARSASSIS